MRLTDTATPVRADHMSSSLGVPLVSLIDAMGTTLVTLLAGRLRSGVLVRDVVVIDPFDGSADYTDALLVGVGVSGPGAFDDLVDAAREQSAAAVLVREVVPSAPALARAARAGVTVLGVAAGVGWSQVVTTVTNAMVRRHTGEHPMPGGSRALSSLGRIASTLASALGAPVTIEDLGSRVLAFSGNQEHGDTSRRETILRGRVPREYAEQQKAAGVFAAVYASSTPVYFSPDKLLGHELGRVVMRAASGGRVLGTIWVAVNEAPDANACRLLVRAAEDVAEILEQDSRQPGPSADRRRATVERLLAGGLDAGAVGDRLGMTDHRVCVLRMAVEPPSHDTSTDLRLLAHVADVTHLWLGSFEEAAVAADIGDVVVGILPVRGRDRHADESFAVGLAERLVRQLESQALVRVVVSPVLAGIDGIPAATAETNAIMRAVRVLPARKTGVWRAHEAMVEASLLALGDRLRDTWSAAGSPIQTLMTYDDDHRTELTAALHAYLESLGSVAQAASLLYIHPNTLRYRLRRASEISGIDLEDPDSRFAVMLELRLRRVANDHRGQGFASGTP